MDKYKESGMLTQYTSDRYSTPLDLVRTQRMYFLRKVHKTPHQLRSIMSCCGGPTQKLSQLTNNLLRDYLHTVPSLVTSSTQVIHAIESLSIPPETDSCWQPWMSRLCIPPSIKALELLSLYSKPYPLTRPTLHVIH